MSLFLADLKHCCHAHDPPLGKNSADFDLSRQSHGARIETEPYDDDRFAGQSLAFDCQCPNVGSAKRTSGEKADRYWNLHDGFLADPLKFENAA